MANRKISELHGENVVVYDIELANPIGNGTGVGWTDYDKMKISVAALFDYKTGDTNVYMGEAILELIERLNSAKLVVGFNIVGFDNPLLRAKGKLKAESQDIGSFTTPKDQLHCYDVLVESRMALGWKPGSNSYPRGCKLDDHLLATFGKNIMKTGHGAEAPKWWQEGKYSKVLSYCIGDVRRERMLFEMCWVKGEIKTPTNGVHKVRHPSMWLEFEEVASPKNTDTGFAKNEELSHLDPEPEDFGGFE